MEEGEYASDFETFSEHAEITLAPPAPPPSPPLKLRKKKLPKIVPKASAKALNLKKHHAKNPKARVKESKTLSLAPELKEHFLDRIRQLEDINHEQKVKIKQLTKEIRTLESLQKRQEKALTKKENEEAQWHGIIDYLTQELHSLRLQPQLDSVPHSRVKHELENKKAGRNISPYLPTKISQKEPTAQKLRANATFKQKSIPPLSENSKKKNEKNIPSIEESPDTISSVLQEARNEVVPEGKAPSPEPSKSNEDESILSRPKGFPISSWYPTTTFKPNYIPHVS